MDRARMSSIMNTDKLEVTVKSRYWCVFPVKFSLVFILEFFSSEVMNFKAIFIHLLSHFLDHEINCGISQIKNAMIPITKIAVMTVARVSFFIKYFHTSFEQSFRYRLPLNYYSIESMDQPCTSETWSRPQSSWPYKISAEQKWQHGGIQFFWCRWIKLIPNNIRLSCWPRVSYQEIFTDWITKEPKPYWI